MARSIIRKDLDIDFEGLTYSDKSEHECRLRFPPARLYRAKLHFRSRRAVSLARTTGTAGEGLGGGGGGGG